MMQIKRTFVLLILSLLMPFSLFADGILSSGKWVKLEFSNTGVYKINYNQLVQFGINPTNLNPQNIHFYSIQGKELSETNDSLSNGLLEIPIKVIGENDGVFDQNDYILIYKQSVRDIIFNGKNYEHFVNFYSNQAFGILGYNNTKGIRIEIANTPVEKNPKVFNYNESMIFHDTDLVNPTNMGRFWVGEKLGNETLDRTFIEKIPAGIDTVNIKVSIGVGMNNDTGRVIIKANNLGAGISLRQNSEYETLYPSIKKMLNVPVLSGNLSLNLKLFRSNSKDGINLDYYEITYKEPLSFIQKQFPIQNTSVAIGGGQFKYKFNGTNSNYLFFNVSNPSKIVQLPYSNNNGNLEVIIDSNQKVSRIWAFDDNFSFTPKFIGEIKNQDILKGANLDFLIISHPDFITAANDLAKFRTDYDHFSTKVANLYEIYNEYGGGQHDLVAIRNYIRSEYFKSNKQLKYVLLLGTASYDMQGRVSPNSNFIPIYQSTNGTDKQSLFCLDDFLGYLQTNSGNPLIHNDTLDVVIGRIPARTLADAQGVVNKLKRYSDKKALGSWRNRLTFVCDDIDKSYEAEFTEESEQYATYIAKNYPNLRLNKVYADAFKQVTNGNNEKYPEVSSAITSALNDGTLFMNYQGHGGEKGWAQEEILDIPMINSWSNKYKMPVLFTATCEFARYDDPKFQSGGELALLNPNGGAIGLMTTTRLVFVSGNTIINDAFWTKYGFPKPNQPIPTLGEVYKRLKNRPSQSWQLTEDNKFALLGDPSMEIAFPKNFVSVDSINGQSVSVFEDTVKAFSVVKLSGHITERLKTIMTNFNGTLDVEVYDKPTQKYTLNNNKVSYQIPFKNETSILYKGSVSVVAGKFTLVFSVPKDIAYNIGKGRAVFYAQNGETDASGSWVFNIGGSEKITEVDTVGPQVQLFVNDSMFINNSKVSSESKAFARIYDKSGINATGAGIGRDLEIILDEGTENAKSYVVNNFFTYENNSYQLGYIDFPLPLLTSGQHTLKCRAWDVYNNSGENSISFEVVPGRDLIISEHGAIPNPSLGETVNIWVSHNLSGEDLTVNWEIYSTVGSLMAKGTKLEYAALSKFNAISWDGRGDNGIAANGNMFYYKINVKTSDGLSKFIGGKFIKLR